VYTYIFSRIAERILKIRPASTFAKIIIKHQVAYFFWDTVYMYVNVKWWFLCQNLLMLDHTC